MKESSKWMLKYIASIAPLGVCRTSRMPPDTPIGVSMTTIRGLEKRGFVKEDNGVFFITAFGIEYANKLSQQK